MSNDLLGVFICSPKKYWKLSSSTVKNLSYIFGTHGPPIFVIFFLIEKSGISGCTVRKFLLWKSFADFMIEDATLPPCSFFLLMYLSRA